MPRKRLLPNLPLRLILIGPYVALVLGLATTIGVLSWQAGSRAVDTVSEHLLLETVGRIGQAVDRHIVGSGAALEAAFPNGMAAPPDIRSDLTNLRTRFWIATSLHIDPNNYVYYGNRAGQGFGLYRHSLTEGELRVKYEAAEMRSYYRFTGIDGALNFHSREKKLFDPRVRPWYKAGETAGSDIWTSVYIDFGTQELVATRARRVLSADGALEGVVATDISLRALNDFVRNLKVSPNGLAFIIEPSGDLIASSATPNVKRLPDGASTRLKPAESGSPLLAAINTEVTAALARQAKPALPQTFTFDTQQFGQMHVAFDRVRDDAGLEWITVVAMPRSDFMTGVTANLRSTFMIGALAALIAVLIGMRIIVWVSDDLKRLAAAARRVGEGELDTPIGISRQDEIGELAHSFETMQMQLQTDRLTGIANRECFTRRLDHLIRSRRLSDQGIRFAVLFIDLNGFKQINDNFGHEAGDRALIEIAQRLTHCVRDNDLVARYAGDEFVILLRDVDTPEACEPIRNNIDTSFASPLQSIGMPDAGGVHVGAAIGVALYPRDGESAEELIRCADISMYHIKTGSAGLAQ